MTWRVVASCKLQVAGCRMPSRNGDAPPTDQSGDVLRYSHRLIETTSRGGTRWDTMGHGGTRRDTCITDLYPPNNNS